MYALFKSRKQKQIGNPNWKIDKKPKKEKLHTKHIKYFKILARKGFINK